MEHVARAARPGLVREERVNGDSVAPGTDEEFTVVRRDEEADGAGLDEIGLRHRIPVTADYLSVFTLKSTEIFQSVEPRDCTRTSVSTVPGATDHRHGALRPGPTLPRVSRWQR